MIFGAHMSTGGGVWRALERADSAGAEIVQIFVKNNMQWMGRPYSDPEKTKFLNHPLHGRFHAIFGHTGYLINLAAPASPNRDKSVLSLIQEIELADSIGVPFLVMHPGAHLGAGEEVGLQRAVEGLDEVFAATSKRSVKVALENTAGQGTCLGHRIAHLAEIFERVKKPERLAVCLDTAHFFAAGYDLRKPEGWHAAIGEVDRMIGLKAIAAFHLNDSKTDFGSRVDRHAGIGQGKIGREAFRHIVNDERFAKHPGCLETPKSEDLHEDVENLAILRSMVPVETVEKPARKPESKPRAAAKRKVA